MNLLYTNCEIEENCEKRVKVFTSGACMNAQAPLVGFFTPVDRLCQLKHVKDSIAGEREVEDVVNVIVGVMLFDIISSQSNRMHAKRAVDEENFTFDIYPLFESKRLFFTQDRYGYHYREKIQRYANF